jgi:ZIP family zinc transporter
MLFSELHPIVQSLLGTSVTWLFTAIGSATVFFFKKINQLFLETMLGFAAGIMIAAAYWSLLAPAINLSAGRWYPPLIGFLAGGLFLRSMDHFIPHHHRGAKKSEGKKSPWGKNTLLFLAITLHNIPEGLAVGVGFGAVAASADPGTATIASAIALTVGLAIQDLPEGAAVSIPLHAGGMSRPKSFFWGQFSGMIEPIAAVIGASLAFIAKPMMPYALSFAAGAMIYVVAEEIIPEAERDKHNHIATISVLLGFALMMLLNMVLSE